MYRIAGDLAARNYRFQEAVALTRRAVALDPTNSKAHGDLGMHLMRTGDEAEARRALDKASASTPYDAVTYNLLSLLDTLDKFVVEKSGDLIFKFHPDEAPIMREYAMPLAHEALKTLSSHYQFTPQGRSSSRSFPTHDDFAVRTLGLPGMIGALGACFGRVVTMDSPKARPPGTFSWQATLWHELAHVITLQLSNQRVPRWLTEGISVYEEARARPEWGREMEVPFALALQRGEILKLKDLNAGFTRPETIALAYYEASLLVDHIVATHGEPALHTLLAATARASKARRRSPRRWASRSISCRPRSTRRSDAVRAAARRAARRCEARWPGAPAPRSRRAEGGGRRASLAAIAAQLALGTGAGRQAGDRAAFEPLERRRRWCRWRRARTVRMRSWRVWPSSSATCLARSASTRPCSRTITRRSTPARRLAALADKAGDEKALGLGLRPDRRARSLRCAGAHRRRTHRA